jgi:monoamine oxidase
LGVLQSGRVKFTPDLPAAKQNAINCLIMGVALKLLYVFDQPVLTDEQGKDIAALYSPRNPPMWWTPTYERNVPYQVITAFATGSWAHELLSLGEQGALEMGLETLKAELGRDDLRPVKMHLMNWGSEEFTLGGYSVVPVGGANLREVLAGSVGDRLFWAGEATARNPWAGTVHGAYSSGRRAAQEILEVTS